MKTLTNSQKIKKLNQQLKIQKSLYEKKFTKADLDVKNSDAIKWFNKCRSIAAKMVWNIE